eukprot:UC1_evm2s1657
MYPFLCFAVVCAVAAHLVTVTYAYGLVSSKSHFVGDANGSLAITAADNGSVIINGVDILAENAQLRETLTQFRASLDHLWIWQQATSSSGGTVCSPAPVLVQEIPTLGANDWEYFELNGADHLVVANYLHGNSYRQNSIVYRHDGTRFAPVQEIPTVGALDWEYFELDGAAHLVVANHRDGDNTRQNSVVYRHNGARFVAAQEIPTIGAIDWEHFELNGAAYLVVANHRDGSNFRS